MADPEFIGAKIEDGVIIIHYPLLEEPYETEKSIMHATTGGFQAVINNPKLSWSLNVREAKNKR